MHVTIKMFTRISLCVHCPSVLVRRLTKKCSPKASLVNLWLSPHFSFSVENLSDRLHIKERWGFASSLLVSFHPSHSHSLWKSKSQCHHLQHQHHINLFCFIYININLPNPRIWFLHPLICHSWQSKKSIKSIQNSSKISSYVLTLPLYFSQQKWRDAAGEYERRLQDFKSEPTCWCSVWFALLQVLRCWVFWREFNKISTVQLDFNWSIRQNNQVKSHHLSILRSFVLEVLTDDVI